MSAIEIVFATLGIVMLIEGSFLAFLPKETGKEIKRIFKNTRTTIKIGLIEMIIALAILFLIAV